LREEREMGIIENSSKTVDENWADSSPRFQRRFGPKNDRI
jgi:hypothetical protein